MPPEHASALDEYRYSDDWAAQLYGPQHTRWLTDVEVDHSLTKGPRYAAPASAPA